MLGVAVTPRLSLCQELLWPCDPRLLLCQELLWPPDFHCARSCCDFQIVHSPPAENTHTNLKRKAQPRTKRPIEWNGQQLKVGESPLDEKLLEPFQTAHLEHFQHAHRSLTSCRVGKKTQLVLLTQASYETIGRKERKQPSWWTWHSLLFCWWPGSSNALTIRLKVTNFVHIIPRYFYMNKYITQLGSTHDSTQYTCAALAWATKTTHIILLLPLQAW